jgi:hypothetical protein
MDQVVTRQPAVGVTAVDECDGWLRHERDMRRVWARELTASYEKYWISTASGSMERKRKPSDPWSSVSYGS